MNHAEGARRPTTKGATLNETPDGLSPLLLLRFLRDQRRAEPIAGRFEATISSILHDRPDLHGPGAPVDRRREAVERAIEEQAAPITDFLQAAEDCYRLAALEQVLHAAVSSESWSQRVMARELLDDVKLHVKECEARRDTLLTEAEPHLRRIAFLRHLREGLEGAASDSP